MTPQTYIAFVNLNLADQMRSLQKWNGKKWNPKRFEDFSNALRNADKKHGTLLLKPNCIGYVSVTTVHDFIRGRKLQAA